MSLAAPIPEPNWEFTHHWSLSRLTSPTDYLASDSWATGDRGEGEQGPGSQRHHQLSIRLSPRRITVNLAPAELLKRAAALISPLPSPSSPPPNRYQGISWTSPNLLANWPSPERFVLWMPYFPPHWAAPSAKSSLLWVGTMPWRLHW